MKFYELNVKIKEIVARADLMKKQQRECEKNIVELGKTKLETTVFELNQNKHAN